MLNKPHLDPAVAMVNQLIDNTVDFLTCHTNSPEQLVLNVTREQALRRMQFLLQAECSSPNVDGERMWRLISAIVATTLSYVLETMSDLNPYKIGCEWKSVSTRTRPFHSQLCIKIERHESYHYGSWKDHKVTSNICRYETKGLGRQIGGYFQLSVND